MVKQNITNFLKGTKEGLCSTLSNIGDVTGSDEYGCEPYEAKQAKSSQKPVQVSSTKSETAGYFTGAALAIATLISSVPTALYIVDLYVRNLK